MIEYDTEETHTVSAKIYHMKSPLGNHMQLDIPHPERQGIYIVLNEQTGDFEKGKERKEGKEK